MCSLKVRFVSITALYGQHSSYLVLRAFKKPFPLQEGLVAPRSPYTLSNGQLNQGEGTASGGAVSVFASGLLLLSCNCCVGIIAVRSQPSA
jgi:hypothetical protein